jgi:hypothetical protein
MAQIKENWTDISGTVVAIADSRGRPLFKDVSILVDESKPVTGFASFLAGASGNTITVHVAADTLQSVSMKEGGSIRCRVRRGRKPGDWFAKGGSVVIKIT